MNSKRRYKNLYLFYHPRGAWIFSNYKDLSIIFSKMLDAILKFYESENFSDSSFQRIFESENFGFPFSTKNSLTWGLKCKKLNFRKS